MKTNPKKRRKNKNPTPSSKAKTHPTMDWTGSSKHVNNIKRIDAAIEEEKEQDS